VVKVRDVYDEKPLQQAVTQETTIWAMHEGRDSVLEHLNFFNKVISELLVVDVKIDEEDKILILLSSLPQSYDHITSMLDDKETLMRMSCQLSYLMRSEKCQIKRSRKDQVW